MSEQPIRRDDFVRFLQAKALRPACECCGNQNYDLFDETQVDPPGMDGSPATKGRLSLLAFLFPGVADFTRAKTLDVCAISCTNCGHVRLFSRAKILQWIDANP